MAERIAIKRALVSVYDKSGVVELGRALAARDVDIVSTGSTARTLAAAGVPVTQVEQLTGFPECLDGRVKTLHPVVHAGILADRRRASHRRELDELGVAGFDLVVCNLYPFQDTVAGGAEPEQCVEQIDIGGPTMVRAAAKNHANVAVVTTPEQYPDLIAALAKGGTTLATRQRWAGQAFAHTATYDVAVATWMAEQFQSQPWPPWVGLTRRLSQPLRYGENAHQAAALYVDDRAHGVAQATQLGGKAMSYNNYTDTEAAWRACWDFEDPAVAIIKHANPCGIALGATIAAAHRAAFDCDPLSAYGAVVAANREVSQAMAGALKDVFTEVVIAPGYAPEALTVLQAKKNLRILVANPPSATDLEWRAISGGLLLQQPDRLDAPGDDPVAWELMAGPTLDPTALADLAFAWRAARSVKSNAILLAQHQASVGIGMGQVNRVDSCRLAVQRAGDRAAGSVAASDAFFPFADGVQILIDAGVRAIVEPGGSIRDDDTIAACQQAGVTLCFTATRHFLH
jgi:phosphoribosylaminoimidazolecarboxamide formyltransferase/IMP cyclohydrolase